MKQQPKDYPMGRTDQVVYVIRAACILAFGFAWICAVIKFTSTLLGYWETAK